MRHPNTTGPATRMAFAALVILAISSAVAFAQSLTVYSTSQNSAASHTAPTLATQGADLSNATAFSVTIAAPSGSGTLADGGGYAKQGFNDGGTLYCYFYGCISGSTSDCTRAWHRCAPGLDVSLSSVPAAAQYYTHNDFEPSVREGRVYYAADNVSMSVADGGTDGGKLTVLIKTRVQR